MNARGLVRASMGQVVTIPSVTTTVIALQDGWVKIVLMILMNALKKIRVKTGQRAITQMATTVAFARPVLKVATVRKT